MIHALLPLFLTTMLGASVALVGLIDGIAEATAAISKVFSGYLSDRLGRRKPLILFGYGLAAVSKPLFAIATAPGFVLFARFADRIGKGIRGAPRDALVADLTPEAIRGRAYGLRQALDTAGAFIGPLLAIALMAFFADNMRAVFWTALIPAALAVACVLFGVEDKAAVTAEGVEQLPIRPSDLRRFDNAFWALIGVGVVFTLARFSEAFLILRAHQEGLPLPLAPLVLIVMNIVYALGAYPAGVLADRMQPAKLLLVGLLPLILADVALAFWQKLTGCFAGIALWGVHLALTQGLFSKLVSDRAPPDLRGSAFGLYNLTTGLAMLAASTIAGVLWEWGGPSATFAAGAGFSAAAALLVGVSGARRHALNRESRTPL